MGAFNGEDMLLIKHVNIGLHLSLVDPISNLF